ATYSGGHGLRRCQQLVVRSSPETQNAPSRNHWASRAYFRCHACSNLTIAHPSKAFALRHAQASRMSPASEVNLAQRLTQAGDSLGLSITAAQTDQLLTYLAQMQRWNRTYNLTAIRDP